MNDKKLGWPTCRVLQRTLVALALVGCSLEEDHEPEDEDLVEDPISQDPFDPALVEDDRLVDQDAALDHLAELRCDGEPPNGQLIAQGPCGRLLYGTYADQAQSAKLNRVPDYSFAGYKRGGVRIPDVPPAKTVTPISGDNRAMLQEALNEIAALPRQANGFRGALLLRRGHYPVSDSLRIPAGVVLRGEGQGANETVIIASARKQYELLLTAEASPLNEVPGTRTRITTTFVPVGATQLRLESATAFAPGDLIVVLRTPNDTWINDLGMKKHGWVAAGYEVGHERRVVAVSGNNVTVDVPLVDSIRTAHGGGFVFKATNRRLANIGIENLRLASVYRSATDENHGWTAIALNRVTDSFVRRVTVQYFGKNAVNVLDSSFVTVEDVAYIDPKSQVAASRRYPFNVSGASTGILFQRVYTEDGRHSFVTGGRVPGPVVWLDALAVNSRSDDGPHQRWATGLLFDNVKTKQLWIQNRGDWGTGHGWAAGQSMIYNSEAPSLIADAPHSSMNYALGNKGSRRSGRGSEPFGIWQSHNQRMTPRSLYLAQLKDRLGAAAVRAVTMARQRTSNTLWPALHAWAGEGRLTDNLPETPSPMCVEGFMNASGNVCCKASCGQCGGSGCSSSTGGSGACCESGIRASGRLCSSSGPPCVLTP